MTQPAKHTPGPWQISAIQNEPEKISIIDADMCFVAEVWQTYINGESRQQANAHLIAAAPAMYTTGKLFVDVMARVARELERLGNEPLRALLRSAIIEQEAALAQAEGRQ